MTINYDAAQVAARIEIGDVVRRYCRAIDRRDWGLMADVFHDDATMQLGGTHLLWRDFVERARSIVEPLVLTQHRVSNIYVQVEGDTATCETYISAYHLVAAGAVATALFPAMAEDGGVIIGGRYLDQFERRADRWRIVRRVANFEWRIDDVRMSRL